MDSLILICKHLPPLSSLNGAKGLKSLAVFKSEIGQGFRGLWEGLGPVKCLVDRSTLASANTVGGDTLALSSWSLLTATVLPGHLPKAGRGL